MLNYKVTNVESGEVRTWEGEARKCHHTFRNVVRNDLSVGFNIDKIEIEVTGADAELVTKYKEKAYGYLTKLNKRAETPSKPVEKKKEVANDELGGFMNRIKEAHKNGLLTVLEAKVMNYLMTDGYFAEYTFSDVGVKEIADAIGIAVNSAKGVVGSLIKKGYLWVEDNDVSIVYATDKGYELSDEFETRWKPQMQ